MKKLFKILLVLPLAFIACNYEVSISVPKAKAYHYSMKSADYDIKDEYYNCMHYKVWYGTTGNGYGGPAVFAVNITKDSLEIEYYKRQLK